MKVDDFLGPGPECFSCAHCAPPAARECCRLMARGTPAQIHEAWAYRYVLASDPHALCKHHQMTPPKGTP